VRENPHAKFFIVGVKEMEIGERKIPHGVSEFKEKES
jgi:hypothetical protein